MKPKVIIITLGVLCALLAGLLLRQHKVTEEHRKSSTASILTLSNDLVQTSSKLGEQQKVNVVLETNLIVSSGAAEVFSNQVVQLSNVLVKTEAQAKLAAEVAEKEIAKRDAEITRREKEADELTMRMGELNSTITNLEKSISETSRKLAASEGDREVLLKELKRLQAEKAELERQFNDLAVLREQVKKLKEELSIARRIEWIKKGLYGVSTQKGAERLQARPKPAAPTSTNQSLEVEISRQGGAKILSPAATNAPAVVAPSTPAAPGVKPVPTTPVPSPNPAPAPAAPAPVAPVEPKK